MGTVYIVKSGDTLSKIAREHGYNSWRDIYYHADNAEFRRKRPDPDRIYPGDELILPGMEPPPPEPPSVPPPSLPVTPPAQPPAPPPAQVSPGVYNLFWLYPIPGNLTPTAVGRRNWNTFNTQQGIPGLILYPAFLTPAIVVGDQKLELLVLIRAGFSLRREDVNFQLKISRGLDKFKRYNPQPLFEQLAVDDLHLSEETINEGRVHTERGFQGILDARALELFSDKHFTKLYRIALDSRCLLHAEQTSHQLNRQVNGRLVPRTINDLIIQEVLDELNGPTIPEKGKYAFRVDGNDVSVGNLAHLADLHISSRHQVLGKSEARVIEYTDRTTAGGQTESDLDISPPLGSFLSNSSGNLKHLLDVAGHSDSNVDILIIGGDIIDFIPNVCIHRPARMSVRSIWDAVALDDNYRQRYQAFVDYVSFYSLILDCCRRHGKPAFAVSGNHDCYDDAYGISPWVTVLGIDIQRANEGVPADHNLTIYEALVAFGRTFGEIKSTSMFNDDMLKWFYTVLTPFSDFAIRLPNQYLVGLAWGDEEDILDVPGAHHGLGHLPRSDDAVTDKQLTLLEQAIQSGKKIILTTHFTFVSYIEHVQMGDSREGDVEFDTYYDHGDHDMGTFETNRKPLYERYLGLQRNIQCVVTGHSHRRGLYFITRVDYAGDNSVKVRMYDFGHFPQLRQSLGERLQPAIIVSDSGGPVPRHNWAGEFHGWGSSAPSATRLLFAADGSLQSVDALQVPLQPRFIVALDYMDLIAEERVLVRFDSDEFSVRDERRGRLQAYRFSVWLKQELYDNQKIFIEDILMYVGSPRGWARVQLRWNGLVNRWEITGRDVQWFSMVISRYRGRGAFLAMKFGSREQWLATQYNFDSWWNFEFQVQDGTGQSSNEKKYYIRRDEDRAGEPDFAWRERLQKYQV
jgi:hypothetical protein